MRRISVANIFKAISVVVIALIGLRVLWRITPTHPAEQVRTLKVKKSSYSSIVMLAVLVCGLLTIWLVIPPTQPANAATISVLASGTNLSIYSAVTVISNTTVVAYADGGAQDLFVAICSQPACTTSTVRTLDANVSAGLLDIAAVGNNPIVAYHDTVNHDIKIAACSDSTCASAAVVNTIPAAGDTSYPAIVVAGGLPVIAYREGDSLTGVLKVAACTNSTCSSPMTITTVDSTPGVGFGVAMTVGSGGFPIISYIDTINDSLKVAFCADAACSTSSTTTILGTGLVSESTQTSIATLNGNPMMTYRSAADLNARVVACLNTTCAAPYVINVVDTNPSNGVTAIVDLGGIAAMAYVESWIGNGDLKMARCDNNNCTATSYFYLDTTWNVGWAPSMAVRQGLPVISYYDDTYDAIKVYYAVSQSNFTSATPTSTSPATTTGTPTGTPVPSCGNINLVNARFSGNRVLIDIVNQNVSNAILEDISLNWQTLGGFPSMALAQMEMNGEAHWTGADMSPPTVTLGDPGFNAAANRTAPAMSVTTWSAQFVNGPASLLGVMSLDAFASSQFTFTNPGGPSPCVRTLNTILTATPTLTFTPMPTFTSSPTRTFTPLPPGTMTISPTPSPSAIPSNTAPPTATATITPTRTATATPTPTRTPTPTFALTMTPSITPTVSATPTSFTISENEFFAALVTARQGFPDIITIVPDFVDAGIAMTIAVSGGTVGNVRVSITQGQDFVAFNITSIMINGTVATTSYMNIINRDLPTILTTALDNLVIAHFGTLVNVQAISIIDNTMYVNTAP